MAVQACSGGVLLTSMLADVMTNVHSFIIIATNHVGDDIYRFETEAGPRATQTIAATSHDAI